MADEQNEIRRVNWNEVFSFAHVFKSFKMAIHPSKLLLCLLWIVVVFSAGWILSWIWAGAGYYAYPGEITERLGMSPDQFAQKVERISQGRMGAAASLLAATRNERRTLNGFIRLADIRSEHLASALSARLDKLNTEEGAPELQSADDILEKAAREKKDWSDVAAMAGSEHGKEIDRIAKIIDGLDDQAIKAVDSDQSLTKEQKQAAKKAVSESYDLLPRALAQRKHQFRENERAILGEGIGVGDGIFPALLDYEGACFSNAILAVRYFNITGGLSKYWALLDRQSVPPLAEQGSQQFPQAVSVPADDSPGFLFWALMGWQGIVWLMRTHWLFALVFLLITLAATAIFGGAVNRIAALHFAREEKISMAQALRFSAGKFLSFLTAPLIPLVIILGLGLLLAVGGLVGSLLCLVPYLGEIITGVLFGLAIAGGMAIAFLAVGLIAGSGLMYPTIAVEGSDSFDAISRSFSYLFARPWRAAAYGLAALFYGVATYLFVRLFVYMGLSATHCFVKLGWWGGGKALGPGADGLDVMWTAPSFHDLWGNFSWAAMSGPQKTGAVLIGVWVFLAAGVVLAYALSFMASSSTAIYFILRRKVDATDLDDVYVEEAAEPPPAAQEPAQEQPEATQQPTEQPKDQSE